MGQMTKIGYPKKRRPHAQLIYDTYECIFRLDLLVGGCEYATQQRQQVKRNEAIFKLKQRDAHRIMYIQFGDESFIATANTSTSD